MKTAGHQHFRVSFTMVDVPPPPQVPSYVHPYVEGRRFPLGWYLRGGAILIGYMYGSHLYKYLGKRQELVQAQHEAGAGHGH